MKNDYFKAFIEEVKNAETKDPIWYMGYLWIDLTKKQAYKTINVLMDRSDCKLVTLKNGKQAIEIPSGMAIYLEQ